MEEKEKIAVVGLQSGKLTGFIKKLSKEGFPILIVSENEEREDRIRDDLRQQSGINRIELHDLNFSLGAADVIAFINPHDWDSDLIERLKEAKFQKTIMAIFEGIPDQIAVERFKTLEDFLPEAQLARVVIHSEKEEVFISGKNKEAVQRTSALLEKSNYHINH